MIIVINSQGGLVAQQPEDIFQGSSLFNEVNLIAPFGSNVVFRANFELPDGTIKPSLEGQLMKQSISTPSGFNVWKAKIDFPLSQYSGILKMQVRGMIGETVVCTTTVKFPIQKGVPYQSEYVEETTYDAIVQMISDVRALINGKVDINHITYVEDETVTASTVGTRYVWTIDGYVAKTLPQDYVAGTTYYDVGSEQIIGNNDTGLYFKFNNTVFEIKDDWVYLNGQKVIVSSDMVAEKVSYNNALSVVSATTVQGAIDEVGGRVGTTETDIADLQSDMTSTKNRVGVLETTSASHTASINSLSQNKADKSEIPTKLSDLANDTNFITKAVNNLENYYLKSQTYTKQQVDELISGFGGELKVEFVEELPTASAVTWFSNSHTFYFLKVEGESGNEYEEYITRKTEEDTYVWEMIGGARIDLSGYYTKEEVDELFEPSNLAEHIEGGDYVDVDSSGDTLIIGVSNVETESATEDSTDLITSGAVYSGLATKSSVSVSSTGTATIEGKYITVNGSEWKISGGVPIRRVGGNEI